ncbi:UDP-glucose 4-epimerase [Spironucleus salmonicida]|uniref:UDP-glucose 4-epimerase n=2 Tax=Spironucleus TaxID=39709 RepID=V6LQI4_9EUKA|nr:UDP-glucose 4-epimerase [Spironucleus barkhanus]KAH0576990.1 UDP-glucose 4-epimerase [Spironucleus salmonicida]KAH0576993.1 UDP-glucose 4-epimerase [Spironucleus salmonicida]|eukprot:EST43019.1 UDP-glucose 4-epimerase [Spironucleus salmonicida]
MSVLITGGAGFIGSHFVSFFASKGYKVTVLDNFATGRNLHADATYVVGDVTDTSAFDTLSTFDFVVHLAAAISVAESMTNPAKYQRSIVEGSRNVFAYAVRTGARAVLSASSAAVYGDCGTDAITEAYRYGGISPYAQAKYDMEGIPAGDTSATRFIFCRFFNVFGPRQDPSSPYTGVMSIFIDRALRGIPITIFGDGEQTRDFVYVKDLVCGAFALLDGGASGVFNIGTGRSTAVQRLAEICADLGGSEIVHAEPRDGDIKYSLSCPEKIFETVGWRAETEFLDGLKATWQWAKDGDSDGFTQRQ